MNCLSLFSWFIDMWSLVLLRSFSENRWFLSITSERSTEAMASSLNFQNCGIKMLCFCPKIQKYFRLLLRTHVPSSSLLLKSHNEHQSHFSAEHDLINSLVVGLRDCNLITKILNQVIAHIPRWQLIVVWDQSISCRKN